MNRYKKIGNDIKLYREKISLPLSEMSARTGIATSKLLKIEEGNVIYNFKTLEKISVCLKVQLKDLLNIE